MLFQRRHKLPLLAKIRNMIWPTMGLKRLLQYYKHRTVRIPASAHSIASGLAFGCAISWTPTFGTHLLQCAAFSFIFRANWVAAFLGSALGNPWTTPLMMLIAYHVGKAFFIATGHSDFLHLIDGAAPSFKSFLKAILEGKVTLDMLQANFQIYLLPALIGGYMMALATYPLFYYPFYGMIKSARAARAARIAHKVHVEAAEITRQAR